MFRNCSHITSKEFICGDELTTIGHEVGTYVSAILCQTYV